MRYVLACVLFAAAGASRAQVPERLRSDGLVDPMGVDAAAPRLSWQLSAPLTMQRAYQVRAASSAAALDRGAGELWDTGKVVSSASAVVYAGPPPGSRDRVFWQVRVWADPEPDAASPWSEPAVFEMGLMRRSDWAAQWISHPTWVHGEPLPIFARQFTISKALDRARLYIAGLGVYHVTLNGAAVTEDVLAPGNTNYAKQVEYAVYDVAALLRQGPNGIGVQLGNGTFNAVATEGRYMKFTNPASAELRLIAQLELYFSDGSRETIGTDTSWRTTLGPTTLSTWFGGEDYDPRREPPGWDSPGADLSGWAAAALHTAPAPGTRLAWRPGPPVRVVDRVNPVRVTEPLTGVYVFDMGVNFAGWPVLRVETGPRGSTVILRIGEQLNSSGVVSQATTGGPILESYRLSGNRGEKWHPRFLYHGFRYVQVNGLRGQPDAGTLTGMVLRGANESAGSFTSSHPLLNDIHRIVDRAIQSNMLSIFTDCPNREKLGWLADMQLIFDSIARNYDIEAYMGVIVRNMAEAQTETGLVPDFAPEYVRYSGGLRDDPNWGNAIILAPWSVYETYGDSRLIETYYPNMARYLEYLTARASGNLIESGLGDWITPDTDMPRAAVESYGYYRAADTMRRAAALLGKDSDAARYGLLARGIADAFNARFLDRAAHTYAGGYQAADALALDMGIVPAEERHAVLEHLIASIRAAGNHIRAGIVSLPAFFRVLSAAGRDDVLFDFAIQTSSPSYGYQLAHGATSLTEEWDGPTSGGSQNHMMLGAIDEWFTAGLAGIRQAPGSAGFVSLVIRPAFLAGLDRVSGTYRTPQGIVSSSWDRTGDGFRLEVSIPPNTTATVHVPAEMVSGRAPGVQAIDGYAVYRASPGRHVFRLRLPGSGPLRRPRRNH